ncbi:sugar transporter [Jannaschia sp. Os4]|nr:sugar transporter [Jannaschia sp. Os4]
MVGPEGPARREAEAPARPRRDPAEKKRRREARAAKEEARAEAKAAKAAAKAEAKVAERAEKAKAAKPPPAVRPPARPSAPRGRHVLMVMTLIVGVILPSIMAAWYLWTRATDQYASYIGFSIRAEDVTSSIESVFGGLGGLGAATGAETDADIVHDYARSQELVQRLDERLDLRAIWSPPHDEDPVFALAPDASLEDLVDYWGRMVSVALDSSSNLLEVRVLSFDPEDSRAIALAVFEESSATINRLTAIAREDATRYAREELERALERLKDARAQLLRFRSDNQIVDPLQDLTVLLGVLNSLQGQLAEAFIELDLLQDATREGDPRLVQAQQRIDAIQARIDLEREKFGGRTDGGGATDYSRLVGEYERLSVDLEFAQAAYAAALTALDAAQAEAQRQSRYLAAYVGPTLAETPAYPRRPLLLALVVVFLFVTWATIMLAWYSVRDRR